MKKAEKIKKEKKQKSKFKRLLPLLTAALSLAVLLTVMSVIRKNTAVAEFVTRNVSRYIVRGAGFVTDFLPFSLYEWFVIAAIAGVLFFIVLLIVRLRKKRFFKSLKSLCIIAVVILSVTNLYTLSAGFAYFREPVSLPLSESRPDGAAANAVCEYFLADYTALSNKLPRNEDGDVISPYSRSELADALISEYGRLGDDYFFGFTPKAKFMLNSWFMSSTGYSGVTFMPTGEPNLSAYIHPTELPVTMAHELAHAKGVMREYEANLTAYYILLTSSNEYLRYCGYFACFGDFLSASALANNYDWDYYYELSARVPQAVTDEANNARMYWWNHPGRVNLAPLNNFFNGMRSFMSRVYNLYLKSNGAENGDGSYDNPWDIIDTGETDPETQLPVYEPVYSNIHKLYFAIYEKVAA